MEINGNMNAGGINNVVPARRVVSGTGTKGAANAFAGSAALEGALNLVPDVRPEAVSRARELINDPSYPSDGTISKLSDFLAVNLASSN